MSDGPLVHWRRIAEKVFPWLQHVRKAADKGLSFRTADGLLHLQGDAGDPAAARVGDSADGGGFAFYPGTPAPSYTPPSLWYTPDRAEPYTWSKVTECIVTGPLTTDAGTRVAAVIITGSRKVTIAT